MTYDDWKADIANREGSAPSGDDECSGCNAQVNLTTDKDGRLWCEDCCPQLFCEACLQATGGACKDHPRDEGPEPWGPGWF